MSLSIEAKHLGVTYGEGAQAFCALENVNFRIEAGQFVSIIGASGCGKSTLLSVLEGLRKPTAGVVEIDGVPITGTGPDRSVVFQQYSLFPWMTARKNVEFALKHSGVKRTRRQRREQATRLLEQVRLSGFEDRFPHKLSGGQQQRVAIARALATQGDILLMDEPFGAIDARNRALLQDLLLELWENEGVRKTVVFITHDLEEAILLSDRILLMEAGPGRVTRQFDVPFARPRNRLDLLADKDYAAFRSYLADIFFEGHTLHGRQVITTTEAEKEEVA